MKKGKILALFSVLLLSAMLLSCDLFGGSKKKGGSETTHYAVNFELGEHGTKSDAYKEQKVKKGDTANRPDPDPFDELWGFTGWFEQGSDTAWDFDTKITKNITLYAHWNEKKVVKGVFSVSRDKKVQFAKGNVQYIAKTGEWKFADKQYDTIGKKSGNITEYSSRAIQSEPIDLFCWAATGLSSAKVAAPNKQKPDESNEDVSSWDSTLMPYENRFEFEQWDENNGDIRTFYKPTNNSPTKSDTLDVTNGSDWGACFGEKVSEGVYKSKYRTLKDSEWSYLLGFGDNKRDTKYKFEISKNKTDSARFALINLKNGEDLIHGLLIFPDDFKWENTSIEKKPLYINFDNADSVDDWEDFQTYSIDEDFVKLENAGCAFLPVNIWRDSAGSYDEYNNQSCYWSSNTYSNWADASMISCLSIEPVGSNGSSGAGIGVGEGNFSHARADGLSVRLVYDESL